MKKEHKCSKEISHLCIICEPQTFSDRINIPRNKEIAFMGLKILLLCGIIALFSANVHADSGTANFADSFIPSSITKTLDNMQIFFYDFMAFVLDLFTILLFVLWLILIFAIVWFGFLIVKLFQIVNDPAKRKQATDLIIKAIIASA